MIGDGHGQQPSRPGHTQPQAIPEEQHTDGEDCAANHMHRSGTEAANQQKQQTFRSVLRQVTDIFKGCKA